MCVCDCVCVCVCMHVQFSKDSCNAGQLHEETVLLKSLYEQFEYSRSTVRPIFKKQGESFTMEA